MGRQREVGIRQFATVLPHPQPSLCPRSPLTPGVPAQDEFADFIVDEDEEAVGEGTEPPAGPAEMGEREAVSGATEGSKRQNPRGQKRLCGQG